MGDTMDEYLDSFKKKHHSKKNVVVKSSRVKVLVSKFLLAVIFFLVSIIFTNLSDNNLLLYKEHVLTESLPFTKVKGWYENIFGKVLPKENLSTQVFSDKILYKSIKDYKDGEEIELSSNTLINNITSGLVVFIGEKEGYGNTVIIQGIDGADIWYGNVSNVSVKLYDYIESGNVLAEAQDKLYLVIKKDNQFIKYENYQNK